MSEPLFDIIFRGDIVIGHNIQDVKQRLSQLFKIDAAKVDALFAGGAVPLKRNVDQATAEKYKAILSKAGAQVQIRSVDSASEKKAPARPRRQSPENPPESKPQQTAVSAANSQSAPKKLTLKERLALQEQEAKKAAVEAENKATETKDDGKDFGFSLAPTGSILGNIQKNETPAPQVDVSAISLKPMQGDLLEPTEKKQDDVPAVAVEDYGLAEVGAEILKAEEKQKAPEANNPISDFDLAEVGADLLKAAEKITAPPVEVNTESLSLAPVGSDMGEKKKDPPPPAPDTSKFSLSS